MPSTEQSRTRMMLFLASIAFSTGAIVMALEIAGSRVLTPIFGSSTTTWGILIGIVLTGLTIGYFFGGRLSDSKPSFEKLCSIIFSTGLYILFIPFISQSLIEFFIKILPTSTSATFFSALAIFGFPAVLLGFVSPYAIKLAARTFNKIGTTAGNLYSISTLGSIFGTFFTIFVLIPLFEIHHLILAFGFTLMIISVIKLGKLPKIVAGALIIIFISNSATLDLNNSFGFDSEVLVNRETPYGSLTVTQKENFRTMYIDGAHHSSLDLEDPFKLVLYYTTTFHLVSLINSEIEQVLFVGGGGFSGPKSFFHHYEKITIEASEIDPVIIEVAKKYFFVPESERIVIINEDSRVHLTQVEKQYDAIILDAYRGYDIPFHLMTKEFYELLDKKLSANGIVISNVVGALEGNDSKLFQANYKTMSKVFEKVYAFPTNINSPEYRQNITLVALKGNSIVEFNNIFENNTRCDIPELDCEKFFENYYEKTFDDSAPMLTDQFSPVDRLDTVDDTSFIYEEIKNDGVNLQEFIRDDFFVQVGLILGLLIWAYSFQSVWRLKTIN